MVKLHFDDYRAKTNLDHISSAYSKIYRAVYNPGNIDIPYEFQYSQKLKKILDENYQIMKQLLSNKNLLSNSIRKYDQTAQENIYAISNIGKK